MAKAASANERAGGGAHGHGGGHGGGHRTGGPVSKDPWYSYLRKKGLKTTQQREAIVDAFLRSSGHVALEDLLARARRTHPGVGLATVYRTVKLLEEAGLAASRQFQSGHTLYEVAQGRAHHDHLICESCGYIVEFESDDIERLQEAAARRMGFNVLRHRHELFGLCERAQGVAGGRCPAEEAAARKSGGVRGLAVAVPAGAAAAAAGAAPGALPVVDLPPTGPK